MAPRRLTLLVAALSVTVLAACESSTANQAGTFEVESHKTEQVLVQLEVS